MFIKLGGLISRGWDRLRELGRSESQTGDPNANPWAELADLRVVSEFRPSSTEPGGASQNVARAAGSAAAVAGSAVAASAVGGPTGAALGPEVRNQLCGVLERLKSKGFRFESRLNDDSNFARNLKNRPTEHWRFDAVLPGDKGYVCLTSLDDLRVLDGTHGLGAQVLSPGEQEQLAAIQGLWDKGYSQTCKQFGTRVYAADLLNTVRDNHSIYLYPAGAAHPHECKGADDLLTLAYLEGVGSPEHLQRPDRANLVKVAAEHGIVLHDDHGYEQAPHGAFRKLQAGERLMASVGKIPVPVNEQQLGQPEALKGHLEQVQKAFDQFCGPVFEKRRLGFEKDYFVKVGAVEDSIPLSLRMAVGGAILQRYVEAHPDTGIFTHEFLPLYDAMRSRAKDSAELVRMTERILPMIGKRDRETLLTTVRSSPTLTLTVEDDPVRSEVFTGLLDKTGSLSQTLAALKTLPDADSRAVFSSLIDRLPQAQRGDAVEHFQTLSSLEAGPQASLADRADAYGYALSKVGNASPGELQSLLEVAASRCGGDFSRIRTQIDGLVSEFVGNAALGVEAAARPSGVTEGNREVTVGGVVVRKRREPLGPVRFGPGVEHPQENYEGGAA